MPIASLLCTALLIVPWLWPFTSGPLAPVQPYLVSVATAAALLACLGRGGGDGRAVVARGWLAAALVSSGIGLLQYFNLEGALHPWVNGADPGTAFGNLRQPNQLATLLVMGLLALRWRVQRGGSAGGACGSARVAGAAAGPIRWPCQRCGVCPGAAGAQPDRAIGLPANWKASNLGADHE